MNNENWKETSGKIANFFIFIFLSLLLFCFMFMFVTAVYTVAYCGYEPFSQHWWFKLVFSTMGIGLEAGTPLSWLVFGSIGTVTLVVTIRKVWREKYGTLSAQKDPDLSNPPHRYLLKFQPVITSTILLIILLLLLPVLWGLIILRFSVITLFLLGILVAFGIGTAVLVWRAITGIIHPTTSEEENDTLKREITLKVPYKDAFDTCNKSLALLPRFAWKLRDHNKGEILVNVWRREAIRYRITQIGAGETIISLEGIPFPNGFYENISEEHRVHFRAYFFSSSVIRLRAVIRELDAVQAYLKKFGENTTLKK